MAKKPTKTSAAAPDAPPEAVAKAPAVDPQAAIVAAAMRLAADRPWRAIPLADIAKEAGIGLIELYRLFPSKLAILDALARQADALVLAAPVDADDPPHDRLFDVLMRRFDALLPSRAGLKRIVRDTGRLQLEALPTVFILPRSMSWMLEAAGISATGLRGIVRARLLGLAYVAAFRSFLDDDTADLSRTMAALDRALRRLAPLLALPAADADRDAGSDAAPGLAEPQAS